MKEFAGFQIFWNPAEWHWGFVRFDPTQTDLALIYEWLCCIGPLEIRKWAKIELPDKR